MFKWFKNQRDIMRKTGGLAEKEQSTQRKIEVANKIINGERRVNEEPVDVERRLHRMTMSKSIGGC